MSGMSIAFLPTAQATVGDLICGTGVEAASYSPGLTNTAQPETVTLNGTLGPCVSLKDLSVTGGSYHVVVNNTFSCLTLFGNASGVRTFTWNNGQSSTFTYTASIEKAESEVVATYTGTITGGEFAGDHALMVVTSASLSALQCATPPGVQSSSGTITLAIS
ncbi:hypothetical protein [Nocardia pseudobrasiliensis]|uniref:hypothetical protein n=1 Tax=Nocardia pseudobrasiliensis TaxID=45979 RepID=UPI0011C068B0|nr:hypothetical protein [Nocardia pseudobrasiliensis]